MTLAVALVIAGVWGYYYFSDAAQVLRVLMVLGGLLAAAGVAWLTATGKELRAFGKQRSFDSRLVLSPNGKVLASSDDHMVRLWDVASGKEIRFEKDGAYLAPYWKEFSECSPYEVEIEGQFSRALLASRAGNH